jgi:hypothetical protein
LFDCVICGVSVKYKREHLQKKHQIDQDVYEELIEKKNRGEDFTKDLPGWRLFISFSSYMMTSREDFDKGSNGQKIIFFTKLCEIREEL